MYQEHERISGIYWVQRKVETFLFSPTRKARGNRGIHGQIHFPTIVILDLLELVEFHDELGSVHQHKFATHSQLMVLIRARLRSKHRRSIKLTEPVEFPSSYLLAFRTLLVH